MVRQREIYIPYKLTGGCGWTLYRWENIRLISSNCAWTTVSCYCRSLASARLAIFLERKNTFITTTLCPTRGIPKGLGDEKFQCYESAFVCKENGLIVKWDDKKTKTKTVKCNCYQIYCWFCWKRQPVLVALIKYKKILVGKCSKYMGKVDMAD